MKKGCVNRASGLLSGTASHFSEELQLTSYKHGCVTDVLSDKGTSGQGPARAEALWQEGAGQVAERSPCVCWIQRRGGGTESKAAAVVGWAGRSGQTW